MRRNYLYKPKSRLLARNIRRQMTADERKLWYEYLRPSELRWLRQKPIGGYIVDFYCPKLKLVIEIDGESHIDNRGISYDRQRTKELEKLGLKVLRFWNYDVLDGLGQVENIIAEEINEINK